MFELTGREFKDWRSQFVTSNKDKMGRRYAPYAVGVLKIIKVHSGIRILS